MPNSLLRFLRSGPPPPKVVLLPDALFFTRPVPLAQETPAAEARPAGPFRRLLARRQADPGRLVAAEVELALEALSPFSLAQLYRGHFWRPGAEQALVFAAYRRRFTVDQVAAWKEAELVLPAFATLLGGEVPPGAIVVLASAEGFTAVSWGRNRLPERVQFSAVPADASAEERKESRRELLRALGGGTAIDLAATPQAEPSRRDREIVFRSGDFVSRLPAETAAALDVRDKGELSSLRRARARDVMLWRAAAACLILFGLLTLGEIALLGGGLWRQAMVAQLHAQSPAVARIQTAQSLASRIEDLSTQRLLPLEMVSLLSDRKPASVQFLRAYTNDRNTLTVEAQTDNPGELAGYQNQLAQLAECQKVEVRDARTRNNVASFTLVVTFKPSSVKPAAS